MEKFSLFDLLSFALPGSTTLVLLYWGFVNTIPVHITALPVPDTILIIVLLTLAYFAGHLVNDLGMWLERRLGELPKSWVSALTANPDLAKRLNDIGQKVFDLPFLMPDGSINVPQSDLFYDYAFNALEVSGKLEKVRILQSQYVFLRNTVVLAWLGVLVFGTVFVVQVANGQAWQASVPGFCITATLGCLLAARLSRRMSIKRRHMKMSATLHNFYAFYILENQFKK